MPATAMSGITGTFAMTEHGFRCRAWSATVTRELNDSTGFAQQPWREQLGGLQSLVGSASGYLEFNAAGTYPGFTNISSTGVSGTLTATTGCTISGMFTVSDLSPATSVDGNATFSMGFRLTGTPTVSWDIS